MRGRAYLFLIVMLLSPLKSMHGRRDLSFLETKKNPAPTGEEEGLMMPAERDSLMYFSMASLSGRDKLYRRLLGKGAPGRRSMGQS
jgi:hypothetical protein